MNVNLDVLELVCARLDGADLVNAAAVSRAFLAGAIPALYARVEYTPRHAKRAQHEASPFAIIAARHHLAVHVKRIAVHAAPFFPSTPNTVSPAFLDELACALHASTNLCSFVCSIKILPPLLPHLLHKPRLAHLRICAPIASRQIALLQDCSGLHSLSLDFPSWHVIDALPRWATSMQTSLAHLTLFMSQDTDATVLNATLSHLPRLRGLHVIGCPRLTHTTVLNALSHTPDLHELSFTIFPSQETALPPSSFPVLPLTHLSIDIRASYPGLKSLIARIISRLSPRNALAICGGWIGEIKGSSERADPRPDDAGNGPGGSTPGTAGAGAGPPGQNVHARHSQVHSHGPTSDGHLHSQTDDPPLLTPAVPHHGTAHPVAPPPNLGNPPPNVFGFPFPFPIGNHNNNNDNDPPGVGPPNPPNPGDNPDLASPSLIDSLPSTLSSLHLPQVSPAGLREVVDRCQGIQVLGIVIGNSFASSHSAKSSRVASRSTSRSKGCATNTSVRPQVSVLTSILSRARLLRELIIDIIPHISGDSTEVGTDPVAHGASSGGFALLTHSAVCMLMRESPLLRRIVAEGRVWESSMPIPSSPVPFPYHLDIKPSPARYGPGIGHHHVHGPPGLGMHGGGYGQVEMGNDHWFWLTDSASGGKVYK